MALVIASPLPTHSELKDSFVSGRLPCSFSQEPLWPSTIAELERFDPKMAQLQSDIAAEGLKRDEIVQETQKTEEHIQELKERVIRLKEAEQVHSANEKKLQEELEQCKRLDILTFKQFAESAARKERELVTQLEAELVEQKELLSYQEEGPKLSLLLNCFGAGEETIQALKHLTSEDLIDLLAEDFKKLIDKLPRDQQIVALYTQERLSYGQAPHLRHDCTLCNCATAEEMAAFLNDLGMHHITVDLIQKTGAFGRGSLLFLTSEELQLDTICHYEAQRLLNKARRGHREKSISSTHFSQKPFSRI